jgi:hypothetical protein
MSHLPGRSLTMGLLSVVATAWLAAPTISRAAPIDVLSNAAIDYVFSDASAVFNGVTESITGLFSVGLREYSAEIQLTGPAPYAGLYTFIGLGLGHSGISMADDEGTLQIRFADNLSFADNPLASVELLLGSGGTVVSDTAPTGVAVAIATPIDYVISNASAVFNGVTESITGIFTVDPLTFVEYGAQILVTGAPPYSGLYFDDVENIVPAANWVDATGGEIFFANNLSVAADPLASVFLNGGTTEVAGFAVPADIAEPTSLVLLGVALGLRLARNTAFDPEEDEYLCPSDG